jgi:hypothetical protein
VSGKYNSILRVSPSSVRNSPVNSDLNLVPGLGEAGVNLALFCKVAISPGKDEVGDVVADIIATTDRHDDFPAVSVNGYIGTGSGKIAARGTLEEDYLYISEM